MNKQQTIEVIKTRAGTVYDVYDTDGAMLGSLPTKKDAEHFITLTPKQQEDYQSELFREADL